MVQLARLHMYSNQILIAILALLVLVIMLCVSNIQESSQARYTRGIVILNSIGNSATNVKCLLQIPGTDFIYVAQYSYTYGGKEYITYSYNKYMKYKHINES